MQACASKVDVRPKVKNVAGFFIYALRETCITFDCAEGKLRELDRWKGLDQLYKISHTSLTPLYK